MLYVFAVPKVVINETIQTEGSPPENMFLVNVLKSMGVLIWHRGLR